MPPLRSRRMSRSQLPLRLAWDPKHREQCTTCNEIKNTLLECNSSARVIIWEQARRTSPHGPRLWPNVTIGTILGTGNISPPDENLARNNGQHRRKVGLRGKNKNPDIGSKLSYMDSEMRESHPIEAAHSRRSEEDGPKP